MIASLPNAANEAARGIYEPLAREELRQRGIALPTGAGGPRSFRAFIEQIRPRYLWYPHCEALAGVLEQVVAGAIRRLMIFLPPRHSKSETVSRLFSAYYLRRFPDRFVGLNSYAADLAHTLSRTARENFILGGGAIKGDAAAVSYWETQQGGGLWAAGVGGPITGRGAQLLVIDDPLKNAEEAASDVIREKQKDWYSSTFYTRAEPDAAIVVIQTRWNEDDLSGWLLAMEGEDEPERWHVVSLPAIAEPPPELPPTCSLEPDWRSAGTALCPQRYPLERLRAIQARIGPYYWSSLYQQRPGPREGGLFKWAWFKQVEAAPVEVTRVRYWDTAGTEGGGDYTAGVLMSVSPEGIFTIEDVTRGQWSPGHRDQEIVATAERDGKAVPIWLERESGVGGQERSAATIRALAGFTARSELVTGSKESRADPFAAQAEAGNVRVLKRPWTHALLNELTGFPHGAHDDMVDAADGAFAKLVGRRVLRFS